MDARWATRRMYYLHASVIKLVFQTWAKTSGNLDLVRSHGEVEESPGSMRNGSRKQENELEVSAVTVESVQVGNDEDEVGFEFATVRRDASRARVRAG